jgi:hypothetical protein
MIVAVWQPMRSGGTARALARAFAAVWIGVGIALAWHPSLPTLIDDSRSLLVGAAALLPLVWVGAIDYTAALDYLREQPAAIGPGRRVEIEGRWLIAALAAAAFVVVVYAALAPLAIGLGSEPDLLTTGLAVGLLWSAVEHAVIFCAAFLAVAVGARAVGGRAFPTQCAMMAGLLTAVIALIVQRSVGDALGFDGWRGAVVAISCAASIVVTWGSLKLRMWSARGARLESPIDVFFSPDPAALTTPGAVRTPIRQWLPIAAIMAAAWAVPAVSRVIDWDFLLLKTGVIVLWFAAAAAMLRLTPARRVQDGWLAAACIAPLAASALAGLGERAVVRVTGDPTFSAQRVLGRYTIYNPSFRLADAMLQPTLSARGQAAFLRFVRANTAIASEVPAPNLDFVTPLRPSSRPLHLFLFVVDSLRPDYLSPYNAKVTFTPRIAEFARDSLVFRNAFTRFGGTGLSLPSIWMGAVGLHKQYVLPFWPMNTLEKLLETNGYREAMSVDVIMEQLLRTGARPSALDRGIRTMDYRFCRTLAELDEKISSGAADDGPLFGYSLPQDLHLSNLMSASVPEGESYPGFHAPYAARVHVIDRCFGEFLDVLTRKGLDDDSVVVLTADHGEMLGEEGRWGHAYYLFPQILQVPLLVHLPRHVRERLADPDAISFLTDITPTLYAALGYQPRAADPLMGEPLIGPGRADPRTRRRADYVAAASYSAVYAAIRQNGRRVYIVDATKGVEFAYLRKPGRETAWQSVPVTDGTRMAGQRLIREHLDRIERRYVRSEMPRAAGERVAQQ